MKFKVDDVVEFWWECGYGDAKKMGVNIGRITDVDEDTETYLIYDDGYNAYTVPFSDIYVEVNVDDMAKI